MNALWAGLGLWRLAVYAAILAALVGIGWRIHHNIWQSGYDARDAEARAAELRAIKENDRIVAALQQDAAKSTKAKDEQIRTVNGRLVSVLGELRNRPERRPSDLPTAAGTCEGGTGAGLAGRDAAFLAGFAARAATITAERDDCYRQYESAARTAQPAPAKAVTPSP